jgi:hypothetical protein
VEDFKNIVFLKPTITVPSKPVEFSGMALKWALQQFTEWFEQAREDLGDNVPLILLSYSRSSAKEPEVIRDVSNFLKGMVNMISKHVFNFRLNNKAFSKGNEYQLCCKIHIGTNIFGEDLQQLIEDLRGVSSRVAVFKSVLQCSNMQVINWISSSHCNLDLTWVMAWVAHKCITLKAGICNNSLPELDKYMFLDRDVLQVSFQWRTIYDGCTKSDPDKAKIDALYAVHIIVEKKDHQLTRSLMSSLLASPSFGRQTSMEYHLAPTFSNNNGPAERAKFLETLETH